MDDFDRQTDSADASRGASQSTEPLGAASSGHEGLIDGTVGLSEEDAVMSGRQDKPGGEMEMTGMVKNIVGSRLFQIVMIVAVVAVAGFWWNSGEPPVGDEQETPPGTVAVSDVDDIESATYDPAGPTPSVDELQPVVAARPPLAGQPPGLDGGGVLPEFGSDLGSIPQGEPDPLEEPPSFDSAAPIARPNVVPVNPDVRTGGYEAGSSGQHPLAGVGRRGLEEPSVLEPGTPRTLESSGIVTEATPPLARPMLPTGSEGFNRVTERSESGVAAGGQDSLSKPGTGLGPRTLESTAKAHPLVAGQPGSGPTAGRVHAIRTGDSYWTISRQYYGTARYFQALSAYNRSRIPSPRKMRPGMKVLVPPRELLELRFASLLPRAVAGPDSARTVGFQIDANGHPVYTVGSADTLTSIARTHLGRTSRWIQIYRMNRDQLPSPHKLKPGTVLRMPADAARLQGGLR